MELVKFAAIVALAGVGGADFQQGFIGAGVLTILIAVIFLVGEITAREKKEKGGTERA